MGTPRYEKGRRFSKLTVVAGDFRTAGGRYAYLCVCDCGNHIVVATNHLKVGDTKSCGCGPKGSGGNNRTHGKSRTPTYITWRNMKTRCYNSNSDHYKYYGGKGIKLCDRWVDSFENFLEDMGEKPQGMEIDRIHADENYSKDNCRWLSPQGNRENKDNTNSGHFGITLSGLTSEQFDRFINSIGRD